MWALLVLLSLLIRTLGYYLLGIGILVTAEVEPPGAGVGNLLFGAFLAALLTTIVSEVQAVGQPKDVPYPAPRREGR